MQEIFSPEPTFMQGQYQKISDNVNDWEAEIQAVLSTILPQNLSPKVIINWQKVDDQQGYAIGTAVIAEGEKSIGVPIIVKQWHLAPLDTFVIEDKAYPLTPDTIQEAMSGGPIGEKAINRHDPKNFFDTSSMTENTFPPLGSGRYVYASDQSDSKWILSRIMNTAWKEDIEAFKEASENAAVLTAAANRGTFSIFDKVAKEKGTEPKKRKLKHDIIQVRKNGVNEYTILGNPTGLYDPLVTKADRPTMKKFVGHITGGGEAEREAVSRVDHNGEHIIAKPQKPQDDVVLYDDKGPRGDKATVADNFGIYGIKDASGTISYGYVFPHVINLDGKKMDIKVFVGRNASSVQPRFAGIKDNDQEVNLPQKDPEPGDTGVFVYLSGTKALATEPVKITAAKTHKDAYAVSAKSYYGKPVTLTFSPNIDAITKLKGDRPLGPLSNGETYVVPSKMQFVPLGETKALPESPEEMNKMAALAFDAAPLRIIKKTDTYALKGPNVEKYANVNGLRFDMDNLSETDAAFLLASFGCSNEKIAQALHPRLERKSTYIYGATLPKLASELHYDSQLNDYIRSLRCDLVKEAAMMDNAEAVDAALSLGFINPDNVKKFIESIPQLKEALSILSKLRLGSRLGMESIPEEACTSAIQNILRVLGGLKKLALMKS